MAVEFKIGESTSGAQVAELGLSLFTVSIQEYPIGATLAAGQSPERPHSAFFLNPIPPEFSRVADYMARRLVEETFEQVRQAEYENLPSRAVALFANTSLDDAVAWQRRGQRSGKPIYRVAPSVSAVLVALDFRWFSYAVRVEKRGWEQPFILQSPDHNSELHASARAYWSGQTTNPSLLEVLVDGSWEITELCG